MLSMPVFRLVLGFVVIGGCADPATEEGGGPGPHTTSLPTCVPDELVEPPHMDIAGAIYSVPVPEALEPYAAFPIGDVSLCRTDTTLELGYSLPKLLVGKKTRVSFEGGYDATAGTYELSSEDGTASCDPTANRWTCFETFTGIEVDLERVADEAADLPDAEAAGRVDVAERFGGDPIGVLDFELP